MYWWRVMPNAPAACRSVIARYSKTGLWTLTHSWLLIVGYVACVKQNILAELKLQQCLHLGVPDSLQVQVHHISL